MTEGEVLRKPPLFGVRRFAKRLLAENEALRADLADAVSDLNRLGAYSIIELEEYYHRLSDEIAARQSRIDQAWQQGVETLNALKAEIEVARKKIVETEEAAILQEVGIYHYRHPLTDVVAYERELNKVDEQIKIMVRRDGGAVNATNDWTVNGSRAEGRAMVGQTSKLMLRAFNAEADNLVRTLKPYKLDSAITRLRKVAETIEKLGRTMKIRITEAYVRLRIFELELTADYLEKAAEEKERERQERERLREERKVQQEIERERAKLAKERQHYESVLQALRAKGDAAGAERILKQIDDVDRAIADVDYRAAHIRAGYVYVISNIGSFGGDMVKIGMTRRLDPTDRIRELSDASVPFNFDVHALFFSKDAVGIETELHQRFAAVRVNLVNLRREFFRVAPEVVKDHLVELTGELLEFTDVPEALEFRNSVSQLQPTT